MYRFLVLAASVLLLLAALLGCDAPTSSTPTPSADLSARATDFAQQKDVAPTYFSMQDATATVTTALFQRVKPLLQVQLKEDGPATPPGTRVQITVTNGDQAAHTVVIRLFERTAPLDTRGYSVAAVTLAAGGTSTTTVTSPLPFAALAAQVLQIDGIWDFGPPPTP
jgi:hypothetical protein